MTVKASSRLARWLLLCAVLFGVVGMHHMTVSTHTSDHHGHVAEQYGATGLSHGSEMEFTEAPAMVASASDCCGGQLLDIVSPAPAHPLSGHDLLHTCMAVIVAGVVLVLFTSHLAGAADSFTGSGSGLDSSFGRSYPRPRTHGRSLALVGVLRQ